MDRVETVHGIHRPHVNRVGFGTIGLVLACLVLLVPAGVMLVRDAGFAQLYRIAH